LRKKILKTINTR